jgi:hypothetical protein
MTVRVRGAVNGKRVKRIKGTERTAVTAAPHKPISQPMYERRVGSEDRRVE